MIRRYAACRRAAACRRIARGGAVVALLCAATVPAEPRVQVAVQACPPHTIEAQLVDGTLRLRAAPGMRYVGWLQESAVDVLVAADATASTWIDSAPWRHGRQPIRLHGDAAGEASLAVRIEQSGRGAAVYLQLQCETGLDAAAQRRHRRVTALAVAQARYAASAAAIDALRVLLAALPLLADRQPETRAWTLHQLAAVARAGGLPADAEHAYRLAAAQSARAVDPVGDTLATLGQAQMLIALQRHDAAAARLAEVRRRAVALQLHHADAVAAHDACLLQRIRGDIEGAIDCLAASAAQFGVLQELRDQGNTLRNRATAQLMLGRYAPARDDLADAVRLAESIDNRGQAALAQLLQAQLARWSGDFETALRLLDSARTVFAEQGPVLEWVRTQKLIGDTYALAGETRRGLDYYRRALREYEQRQIEGPAAAVRLAMARLLQADGRPDEAIALLRDAARGLRHRGTASQASLAVLELARLHWLAGDTEAARASLQRAGGADARLDGQRAAQAAALRAHLAIDDGPAAAARLRQLMAAARDGGNLLLYLDLADGLLALQRRAGDTDAASQVADEALTLGIIAASRLRGAGLRHALLQRLRGFALHPLRAFADGPLAEAQALRLIAPLEALRAVEQQSEDGAATPALDELERVLGADTLALGEDLHQARRDALVLALDAGGGDRIADGAYARGQRPTVSAPAIGDGEALLYLVLGADGGGALVRDARGWRWLGGLDAARLRNDARELRDRLAAGHGDPAQIDARVASIARTLRWHELLPDPLQRLTIVADAELVGIAWDLLPSPGRPARRVLDDTDSLLLQSLRPRAAPAAPRSLHALAAGASAGPAQRRLHSADDEIAAVRASWPALSATVQPQVRRDGLLAALATPAALVHIAAHGRADLGRAEDSGLWVHADDGGSQFVSARRLRGVPTQAGLVVLSACDTGYSLAGRSFGIGGVAGSLVDAGAGAVVATRWPVSDRSARDFSVALHAALAAAPEDPAGAVRHARQQMSRSAWSGHPGHWAGWFLLQRGPVPAPRSDG